MALVTTGFSKPYVALYSASGTNVTYSSGMELGRGVEVSIEAEAADDNNFYANNEIAETESGRFKKGSATITVDGLENAAAKLILGLPAATEVGGVSMQGYGDSAEPPHIGYGCVRRTMSNGVTKYWPLILPKVKFAIPADNAKTQEEDIDWQTQELKATIFRDDTEARNWKLISEAGLETEAAAYAVVIKILGRGDA